MKEELRNYYMRCGILVENFSCKHKKNCEFRYLDGGYEFARFSMPKISREYEENKVPRLLFLSLDRGKEKEEDKIKPRYPKNRHWARTLLFTWSVFKELNNRYNLSLDIGEEKNHDLKENNKVEPYFAHTNSAKCCLNNGKQANKIVFRNCREYLLGEIETLDPQILVT